MSKGNFTSPISHAGLTYLNQLEIWKGSGTFGLSKIARVMHRLGNPQDEIKTLHIAGTNGKGSVSATLASILGAAGKRVGLNTSPHLYQVNERIIVDGEPISFEIMGDLALKVKEASEREGIVLSFHEGVTALSFLAFRELGVEWNVIEVGLGGKYDASNIISKPVVSVITSIDLDHQQTLGETRPEIARQKGGIIKSGCPVVVGPLDQASFEVIDGLATEAGASLYAYGRDFSAISKHDTALALERDRFVFEMAGQESFAVEKGIPGRHQFDNAAVALAAARVARIGIESCQRGVAGVFWPGRLEVFNWRNRVIIIDCAHNPHGVAALVDNLKGWGISEIDIAFGVLDTKDWSAMIDQLIPFSSNWSLLTPDSERALDINRIADHLSGFGVSSERYGTDFHRFTRDHEYRTKPLLITGSIYLIGELRRMFDSRERKIWTKELINIDI